MLDLDAALAPAAFRRAVAAEEALAAAEQGTAEAERRAAAAEARAVAAENALARRRTAEVPAEPSGSRRRSVVPSDDRQPGAAAGRHRPRDLRPRLLTSARGGQRR